MKIISKATFALIIIGLALFFLDDTGISGITGATTTDIPNEINDDIQVYFCPKDDCNGELVKFINSAETSLHCALFDLRLPDVIKAFGEQGKKIDVKIVIDNENNLGLINGSGIRFDNGNQLSHNKFCVKDGKGVWTGSFNPTERGAYKNNNNALYIPSVSLAENYEAEFQELWNSQFGKGEKVINTEINYNNIRIENYFCPDDGCAQQVINKINNAYDSVYFMTFSFTHEGIADALLFNENIDVKGIFETTQAGSKYTQYNRLKDFGLDVIKDSNPANMHHKVFIIDKSIVITGSFNPTGSGDTKNDENILIIYDENIAKLYLEEFEMVWSYS